MRKYKRLIISMIVSMIVSLIIIYLFHNIYNEFNNSDAVVNIFIGILGSSFVTMIGYFFELYYEKRSNIHKIIQYYREVNFKIIPYIRVMDDKKVIQIMEDSIIYNIRDLKADYKLMIKFLIFIDEKIKKHFEANILEAEFIPKHLKILYILVNIHDYLTKINTYIFDMKYLLNMYISGYRFLKKNGVAKEEINQNLCQTKKLYKAYKSEMIKERERMVSDPIWTKCMLLDASVGLINTKNDFNFYDSFEN